MSIPKISVIIPIYDAATYLRACLDSIAAQTESDFEVLMVDDGSTDDSARICADYSSTDPRFIPIATPHAGVSAARNMAIDRARGNFIAFVDADDILNHRQFELLLNLLSETGADVAVGGTIRFRGKSPDVSKIPAKSKTHIFTGIQAVEDLLYQKHFEPSPCAKLFRREILNGNNFVEGMRYEDLEAMPRILFRCRKVAFVDTPVYYYRQHSYNFINTFNPARLDALRATAMIDEFVAANIPQLRQAASDRRLSAAFNILTLLYANGQGHTSKAEECRRIITERRKQSLADHNVRFKNKAAILLSYLGFGPIKFLSKLFA